MLQRWRQPLGHAGTDIVYRDKTPMPSIIVPYRRDRVSPSPAIYHCYQKVAGNWWRRWGIEQTTLWPMHNIIKSRRERSSLLCRHERFLYLAEIPFGIDIVISTTSELLARLIISKYSPSTFRFSPVEMASLTTVIAKFAARYYFSSMIYYFNTILVEAGPWAVQQEITKALYSWCIFHHFYIPSHEHLREAFHRASTWSSPILMLFINAPLIAPAFATKITVVKYTINFQLGGHKIS